MVNYPDECGRDARVTEKMAGMARATVLPEKNSHTLNEYYLNSLYEFAIISYKGCSA